MGLRYLKISEFPYYFKREYVTNTYSDKVVVGLELEPGLKEVNVEGIFRNGDKLRDYYSGKEVIVKNNKVRIKTDYELILLGLS